MIEHVVGMSLLAWLRDKRRAVVPLDPADGSIRLDFGVAYRVVLLLFVVAVTVMVEGWRTPRGTSRASMGIHHAHLVRHVRKLVHVHIGMGLVDPGEYLSGWAREFCGFGQQQHRAQSRGPDTERLLQAHRQSMTHSAHSAYSASRASHDASERNACPRCATASFWASATSASVRPSGGYSKMGS